MSDTPSKQQIRAAVNDFLQRELPQIQMHGGESTVAEIDMEDKSVTIQLSGACGGCGISPMTIQAMKKRLPQQVDGVKAVHAETVLDDTQPQDSEEEDNGGVQSPF